jgi:tripartite-type tricarboxylate transporter receptor subunit TctC
MRKLQRSSESLGTNIGRACRLRLRALTISAGLVLATTAAAAQDSASDYPNRAVRIIVNVSPGGGVDTATRIVAQRLADRLGQPFVVENRASASGNVGAEAVFHAAPDGYTLLSSSGSPLAINGWIYKKLNYDPAGFEPVAIMSRIPNVLVVRNDFPAATVKDFIDYVKAHPGKVSYASQGSGTASHLTAELFMALTKTSLVHVPYKGTSPALNDLVAGHVDASFIVLSSALELAKAGKLRILAVATEKRVEALPDVPTMVESGYPELISSTWNAISAPPRTPAEIVSRLNGTINEALQDDQVRRRFNELQLITAGGSLAVTKAVIEKERRQWGEVVATAGIKPE